MFLKNFESSRVFFVFKSLMDDLNGLLNSQMINNKFTIIKINYVNAQFWEIIVILFWQMIDTI